MAAEVIAGTSRLRLISLYAQRSEPFRTGIAEILGVPLMLKGGFFSQRVSWKITRQLKYGGLASGYNFSDVSHRGPQPRVSRVRIEAKMPGHLITKSGNFGRRIENPDGWIVDHSGYKLTRNSSYKLRSWDTANGSFEVGDMDSDLPFVSHRGQSPIRRHLNSCSRRRSNHSAAWM